LGNFIITKMSSENTPSKISDRLVAKMLKLNPPQEQLDAMNHNLEINKEGHKDPYDYLTKNTDSDESD